MINSVCILKGNYTSYEWKDLSTVWRTISFLSPAKSNSRLLTIHKTTMLGVALSFLRSCLHRTIGGLTLASLQGTDRALMKAWWPCKISGSIFQYFIMPLRQRDSAIPLNSHTRFLFLFYTNIPVFCLSHSNLILLLSFLHILSSFISVYTACLSFFLDPIMLTTHFAHYRAHSG